MAGDARTDWVLRVLGVQVGGAAAAGPFDEAAFRRKFAKALQSWRDTSEEVEAQLNVLRQALLKTTDKDLHKIAEVGLNGLTGTRKVGLQTALRELAGASGPAVITLAQKAVSAAQEYRGWVESNEKVKACDAYPHITTPIGPTLGRALGELADALTI